jgi:hypothetical protein
LELHADGRPSTLTLMDIERQLRVLRVMWAMLLMGELIFFVVIVFVIWPKQQRMTSDQTLQLLFRIGCAMLLTLVPITFVVRSRTWRNGRDERGNLRPSAYASGCIICWSGCEGVAMFGLVGALLSNGPWPFLILTIIAVGAQILAFPTGAPMRQSL